MVELIVALAILATGFLALAGAFASASKLIVQGRQRQSASQEANGRLEFVRNIPYARVALTSTPAFVADPRDPEFWVNPAGTGYDHDHNGTYEPFLIDTTDGQVAHLPAATPIGTTAITVYQYVTWVDDPGITGTQDYKRVTIVVAYSDAQNPGRSRSVQTTALLTLGTVTVGGAQQGGTQGVPSATPTPTPTTSECDDDNAPPGGTFTIQSGTGAEAGFTASTSATLQLAPTDTCTPITVQLSNDNVTYGASFEFMPANPSVSWTLTPGDGVKSVWAKFRDAEGLTSIVGPKTIILDMTPPTVPGTLTRAVSCSGNDRTVSLTWGASVDANFLGYRVYRSVNAGAFLAIVTSQTSSTSDTDAKTLDSVEFKVVGYDKAGNEGNPTNVIALAKNQCS